MAPFHWALEFPDVFEEEDSARSLAIHPFSATSTGRLSSAKDSRAWR